MPIKEINNNGKSKIIASHTGVLNAPKNGHTGNKADSSAPSHNKRPIVDLGHSRQGTDVPVKKVLKDQGTGGSGARGSY